jgi:hypothetical protein
LSLTCPYTLRVGLKIKFSSFVKLSGASRKSESDSGAGDEKKGKVLLRVGRRERRAAAVREAAVATCPIKEYLDNGAVKFRDTWYRRMGATVGHVNVGLFLSS